MMKIKTSCTAGALLLSIPAVCMGYGDSVGAAGILMFLLKVAAGGWILICVTVFFLMHKTVLWKRWVYSIALFVAPAVALAIDIGSEYLAGEAGDQTELTATRPVTVAGVTFPTGSRIVYEQTDSSRWHKRIAQAESDQVLRLGTLKIIGLRQDNSDDERFDIELAEDQSIDGWTCASAVGFWTTVSLPQHQSEPHLQSCWLAQSRIVNSITWPAYSNVSIGPDNEWSVMWERTSVRDAPPAKVFGFDVDDMNAEYDPKMQLKNWSGTVYHSAVQVGDYLFGPTETTHLTWQSANAIKIQGAGKNVRTGAPVSCVTAPTGGGLPVECAAGTH
ncbi:hypothetical protein [Paraburkholderia dilworthii]|uniref:Uncharacterized protein n=1 Tax=Paraburkholderia dilworthii TaxID=948106 RepID=A0ABW9DDZ3_9BURK